MPKDANPTHRFGEPITDPRLAHPTYEGRPILVGDWVLIDHGPYRRTPGLVWQRVTRLRWVHHLAEVWIATDVGENTIYRADAEHDDIKGHRPGNES